MATWTPACAKRPVSSQAIDRMVDDMERQISALAKAEVPASLVGRMVMEGLKSLDHVAYVRFASVYRNFADLESFAQEVEALQRDPEPNLDAALEAQLSLPITGAETPEKGVRRPKKPAAGG
ncbi:MAG: ATP cone domain-containing protein [Chloroflexota bacterium]|nr:ATP cone domain-containing protein [Chloroflexota bacterium]